MLQRAPPWGGGGYPSPPSPPWDPAGGGGGVADHRGRAYPVHELRRFQSRFVRHATAPGIRTAALSLARGNGKSWIAGRLIARALTPGDPLFVRGWETVLVAGSLEQARHAFRFAREELEPAGGYRFQDAGNRVGILHLDTNTRLRVISSNAKTAMGLVRCPLVIADEPGAWEVNNGQLLHTAIQTAQGKPGSSLRAVYIGTLAPATSGWWHDLIERGSGGSRHVTFLQGDPERWDQWAEIRRCNPLTAISSEFRATLLEERDEARRDTRLKAEFLSYRLNLPTVDESEVLLTVDDWKLVRARPVPNVEGTPVVGIDLGFGRAWSAAAAIWPNGRMSALAIAPGIPSIEEQEKRDRVPRGTYQGLIESGRLTVSEGLRVPPAEMLVKRIGTEWGTPAVVGCDLFRLNDLKDSSLSCPLVTRRARWSEAAFDIRSLRKLAKDGPLSCDEEAESMVLWSLTAAKVKPDDAGSIRMVKRDPAHNTGRDDVAAALAIAAGLHANRPVQSLNLGGFIG